MSGSIRVAAETTYGTVPASGWREYEFTSDDHNATQETLQHRGLRRASGAPRVSGRRIIDKGGSGTLPIPAMDTGLGLLLRAAASTASSGVVSGGTDAYEQVFTWTDAGPPSNRALSVEPYRARLNGTSDAYTFRGGRVTQLEIGQNIDEHLMFTLTMDYVGAARQASDPGRTVTEVIPDFIYAWRDVNITLTPDGGSGTVECFESFSLTFPLGMDTEAWCLKRNAAKEQPQRTTLPVPTGSLNGRYIKPEFYDAWRAGTIYSLEAEWEAPTAIEDTTKPTLRVEIPAIAWTGEDPKAAVAGPTMQNLPFEVLDNETDPVMTITYITADTTY